MKANLLDLLLNRRSIRKYKEEAIAKDVLNQILSAGLLAPSGRNRKPWEFVVVEDRETLKMLAKAREHGAGMLEGAAAAIVVFADPELTDVWTEDASIAMTVMHLMAAELGVGSCWIQGRLRNAEEGVTTEAYIKDLLHVPETYKLEAILSLGMPGEEKEPHTIGELPTEKIHWGTF